MSGPGWPALLLTHRPSWFLSSPRVGRPRSVGDGRHPIARRAGRAGRLRGSGAPVSGGCPDPPGGTRRRDRRRPTRIGVEIAHHLRGGALEMGVFNIAPLCAAIEHAASNGSLADATAQAESLDRECAAARVALEQAIAR